MAINDSTTCIRTVYQISCPTTKVFGTTEYKYIYIYIYIQIWLNDFAITIVFAVAFCFLKNRL